MKLDNAKAQLQAAQTHYLEIESTAPAADVRAASDAVKAARKAVSDAITAGAVQCPQCGEAPHGLEHVGKRSSEFEIGCLTKGCEELRVRGGMMPKHAVDAWNEKVAS